MRLSLKRLSLTLLAASGRAVCAGDLKVDEQQQRLKLDVFLEGAYFRGSQTSLNGYGFGSGARYAVYDRLQVGLRMGQALTYDGGPAALYTSFTSQLSYALVGSFIIEKRSVYLDGKLVSKSESARRSLVVIGAGFEQFLFNGTQFAVPSTGLTVHAGYQFPLWGLDWYLSARAGGIVLNKTVVIPIIGNFGPVWSF